MSTRAHADPSDTAVLDGSESQTGTDTGTDTGTGTGTDVSIGDRIDGVWEQLSPQEQRVADFIRAHLDDLAVYNGSELAALSGVSKATVTRLFRSLGFAGSTDARDHVRALRTAGEPLADGASPVGRSELLQREIANLTRALESLDVSDCARQLHTASRVVVVGLRNSYPVALHLRSQLAQARTGVTIAPQPGQSLGEEIAGLTPDDAVVLVGFRRRPQRFADLLDAIVTTGATVVLMADASARSHAASVDHFIECPLDAGLAFDSYAGAMSVVSVLASAVLAAAGESGSLRVTEVSSLYGSLDELERA